MGSCFDFELGELRESPCRRCEFGNLLPDCIQNCDTIRRAQKLMAGGVCSTAAVSTGDVYRVLRAD
jgi:hypothetical protein